MWLGNRVKGGKMIKDENGNEYVIIRHTEDHIYAVNKKLVKVEDKGEEE